VKEQLLRGTTPQQQHLTQVTVSGRGALSEGTALQVIKQIERLINAYA